MVATISPHPLLMLMGEVQRILGSTSLSHSKLRASKGFAGFHLFRLVVWLLLVCDFMACDLFP